MGFEFVEEVLILHPPVCTLFLGDVIVDLDPKLQDELEGEFRKHGFMFPFHLNGWGRLSRSRQLIGFEA